MHYKSLNQEIQEIQAEIKRLEKPGNELEVFSDLIDDMHLMNIVTTARNAFL
jgi:prefoldin subunit 5